MDGCTFCDYAGPSKILLDTSGCYIIQPLDPVTPGHLLAISKVHALDALAAPIVFGHVADLAARYAADAGITACNIITSVGAAATQTVPHLHVHVIPRSPGDGLRLPWSD